MIRCREPALGPDPDYGRAIYCDPGSHDFCIWLIMAEMARRHHGAPAPLRVRLALIEDQLGIYDFGPISLRTGRGTPNRGQPTGLRTYSDLMIPGIIQPAIDMIGAVREPDLHWPFNVDEYAEWVEYDYHLWQLIDAGREGHEVPKWTPPDWAFREVDEFLGSDRPVVITLRESPSQPERNSRILDWLKFSVQIDQPALFVRDTCKAGEPFSGWTWPRASTNAYVRAALYQRALVNLMVCNGPNVWCLFSDAPYLIFKELVPELPDWAHGQPHGWREFDHLNVGDQYPWANPRQRLTWTDDTYGNIVEAFEAFLSS